MRLTLCANETAKLVTAKLLQLDQYKQAEAISVYISTPTEISTADIIRDVFDKGVGLVYISESQPKLIRYHHYVYR